MYHRTCIAAAAVTFALLAGMGQPAASQPSNTPFGRSVKPAKKPATPTPTTSPAPKPTAAPEPAPPQQSPPAQPQAGAPAQQPAAPEPAPPPSPAASAACQTVSACFGQIAARHPYLAVDQYFDSAGFARRILGKNFEKLDSAQQAYFEELSNVMFKSLVSGASFSVALVSGQNPQLSASELNGDVLVSFVTTTAADGQRRNTLVLHQTAAGWKIVDIDTVAQRAADVFKPEPFDPAAAAFGMEAMVGGVIHSKVAHLDDSPSQRNQSNMREAQAGNLRVQLQTLQNQLELYKARNNGQYPDLAAHGWDDLIKGGYLRRAPVNPVNQSSKICIGLRGKPGYGWSWNPSTGELGATYFDEQSLALTPDSP